MSRLASVVIVAAVLVAIVLACTGPVEGEGETVEYLNQPGRTDDLPFSHLVVAGNTVYVSGTIGIDPETGAPPEDPREEARLALNTIRDRLEQVGLTMDHLVTVQVFCSDVSLYEEFNEVYRTYFSKTFPARGFIGSGPLLRNGRFEVMGIAVKR